MDYIRDPDEIYRRSFEIVRAEAELDRFTPADAEVAIRLIHACGDISIAENLIFSANATEAGIAAIEDGHSILCDAEMVASGIIRQRLTRHNEVVCTLNRSEVPARAKAMGNTRSAVALDFWGDATEGAVVAIGNAPTALFRLLELLETGDIARPALIIAMPVGFVGASESKSELVADNFGIPYITLVGRRGGSAIASAAVNAIAGLAQARH